MTALWSTCWLASLAYLVSSRPESNPGSKHGGCLWWHVTNLSTRGLISEFQVSLTNTLRLSQTTKTMVDGPSGSLDEQSGDLRDSRTAW